MDRLQTVVEEQYTKRREIQKQIRDLEKELELTNQVIIVLESKMSDLDKAWTKQKNDGDALSLRVMIEQILESHQTGLRIEELVKELEKRNYQTRAKSPEKSLNTILYRHQGKVFVRGKDGRWTLAKTPEKLDSHLQLVRKNDEAS